MNAGKVLTVARCEFGKSVRSKAFIIGILVMPLFMGAGFIAIALSEAADDVEDKAFAVVDRTGEVFPAILAAAEARNAGELFDEEGEQVEPRFLPEPVTDTDADERAIGLTLSERVRDGELSGYAVIGADLLAVPGSADQDRELAWFTDTPTDDELPDWLEGVVNEAARAARFAEAGLERERVELLRRWDPMRSMGLVEVDASGEVKDAEATDMVAEVVVPAGLAIMLFMLMMMSAPALMNNVLEEKMQKIAEVLVSSVGAFELLAGKLLSAVGVALTLAVIYVGAGLVFVHNVETVPAPVLEALGPGVLGLFLVFLVLALLIFGSIFSALGAACSEIADSQTLVMPAMLLVMIPMFFFGVVIKDPSGVVAQALSYFPPSAPMIMLIRMNVPPGVAWWELATMLAVTTLFTAFCVGAGAKIFRIGILAQGQTPSWGKLIRWVTSR